MTEREKLLGMLLDSLVDSFVFVDTNHVIQYMNKAALKAHQGGEQLIGQSLFDCHQAPSKAAIIELWSRLKAGEDEILISDTPPHRTYMRGVYDSDGTIIGYYERFEAILAGD